MVVIGCDPGVDPALVALDVARGTIAVIGSVSATIKVGKANRTRPVPELIREALASRAPDALVIEEVTAMPNQGISSTAAFMHATGLVHGVAVGLGIPVHRLKPQAWRKAVALRGDKDAARMKVCELWPQQAALFARVKDHNHAEAALIAHAWLLLDNPHGAVHRHNRRG